MRFLLVLMISITVLGCKDQGEKHSLRDESQAYEGPIIDMHIHSAEKEEFNKDTLGFCLPIINIIQHFDPKEDYLEIWNEKLHNPECADPMWSPKSYDNFIERLTYQLKKHNLSAVTSGPPSTVEDMHKRIGDRIIKSCQFRIGRDSITMDSLRLLVEKKGFRVLGEISNQYEGIAPSDPRMEPYYALAEQLDIPVAIHLGSGLPGHFYFEPGLTPRLSNPLELEPIIRKFPKLRISIMHYGEPFIDELIAMMGNFPQLYADIGGIQVYYPREYFYEYHLKKLVSAGFGKRIMFGSDMIIWPEIIDRAVKVIDEAPFLSMQQKEDIFYNNAARFLRMEEGKK